jgi:hypothetical protein
MSAPAGWYPNPEDATSLRWWDGAQWRDETAPASEWPSYEPSALQPPRRRRRWPWVLGGVAVLVMSALGVFVVLFAIESSGSIRGANDYLRDVRDRRIAQSYARLCSEGRRSLTMEQYSDQLDRQDAAVGRLMSFNASNTSSEIGHRDQAIVRVSLRTTESRATIEARMVKEAGEWRWCGSRPAPKTRSFTIHFP